MKITQELEINHIYFKENLILLTGFLNIPWQIKFNDGIYAVQKVSGYQKKWTVLVDNKIHFYRIS